MHDGVIIFFFDDDDDGAASCLGRNASKTRNTLSAQKQGQISKLDMRNTKGSTKNGRKAMLMLQIEPRYLAGQYQKLTSGSRYALSFDGDGIDMSLQKICSFCSVTPKQLRTSHEICGRLAVVICCVCNHLPGAR